jgi:hypothetical protein
MKTKIKGDTEDDVRIGVKIFSLANKQHKICKGG